MFFEFFTHNYFAAYILVIATVIFAYAMSANVKSTFKKYDKVYSRRGVQANAIARQILDSYGLYDTTVVRIDGKLSDHYDPKNNVVALSDSTFFSTSVAAIGVAAHEVGHAVQHAKGYLPIKIRNAFVPVVQFSSTAWLVIFLVGMFMSLPIFVDIGIWLFAFIVLFQIVTIPVEFNASRRAIATIQGQNLLDPDEIGGAKATLRAAALTYVASLMVSIAQLLRLLASSNRRR